MEPGNGVEAIFQCSPSVEYAATDEPNFEHPVAIENIEIKTITNKIMFFFRYIFIC